MQKFILFFTLLFILTSCSNENDIPVNSNFPLKNKKIDQKIIGEQKINKTNKENTYGESNNKITNSKSIQQNVKPKKEGYEKNIILKTVKKKNLSEAYEIQKSKDEIKQIANKSKPTTFKSNTNNSKKINLIVNTKSSSKNLKDKKNETCISNNEKIIREAFKINNKTELNSKTPIFDSKTTSKNFNEIYEEINEDDVKDLDEEIDQNNESSKIKLIDQKKDSGMENQTRPANQNEKDTKLSYAIKKIIEKILCNYNINEKLPKLNNETHPSLDIKDKDASEMDITIEEALLNISKFDTYDAALALSTIVVFILEKKEKTLSPIKKISNKYKTIIKNPEFELERINEEKINIDIKKTYNRFINTRNYSTNKNVEEARKNYQKYQNSFETLYENLKQTKISSNNFIEAKYAAANMGVFYFIRLYFLKELYNNPTLIREDINIIKQKINYILNYKKERWKTLRKIFKRKAKNLTCKETKQNLEKRICTLKKLINI